MLCNHRSVHDYVVVACKRGPSHKAFLTWSVVAASQPSTLGAPLCSAQLSALHDPDCILAAAHRFSNEQLSAWQVLQEAAHDAELFQQMDADAQRAGAGGSSNSVLGLHSVRLAARQLAVAVLQAHAEIKVR